MLRAKRAILLVVFSSMGAFFFGGVSTYLMSSDIAREAYRNLQLFTKVYEIVKKLYVEEPKDEALVRGAIRGMLDSLDPHSVYMTKEEFTEMQSDTRGQFGGLGIEISKRDGALTVISPIEGTPAYKAGIKSGDMIVTIEKQPTEKMSVIDAVKLMRGKPGDLVNIQVRRENVDRLIDFSIRRAIINVASVTSKEVEGFPVIKMKQFLERSGDDMRKALKKFSAEKPIKGLVLDLRNNPGGLLQQAVEVSDAFLKDGLIVSTRGRDPGQVDNKYAAGPGTEPDYPIVVLINGGSASASEIVAGALQDHKRAHILGTQSFGKGSVQNVIQLKDGGGIKLTVALYYTPSNRTIQGLGITPDEVVQQPDEPVDVRIREKDLPGHLVGKEEHKAEEVLKKETSDKGMPKSKELQGLEKEDFQLAKAIEYLKKVSETQKK